MPELEETIHDQIERASKSRLNMWVALLVAITATLMALSNVKVGNISQAMAQAQSNMVDYWGYYQAKGIKQNIAQAQLDQFLLQKEMGTAATPQAATALDARIEDYRKAATRYESEKQELRQKAEAYKAEYEHLNFRDDQFDLADAGLSLAIALFGISALTQRQWLFVAATVLASFGALFAISGFLGLGLHSDFFAKLLG